MDRWSRILPQSAVGNAILTISAKRDKFVDQSSKIYHVACEDSNYFREHGYLIPSIHRITNLCKAVSKYGKRDPKRCPPQQRVNIGCGGQHRPEGRPETLVEKSFEKSLVSDIDVNAEEILSLGT